MYLLLLMFSPFVSPKFSYLLNDIPPRLCEIVHVWEAKSVSLSPPCRNFFWCFDHFKNTYEFFSSRISQIFVSLKWYTHPGPSFWCMFGRQNLCPKTLHFENFFWVFDHFWNTQNFKNMYLSLYLPKDLLKYTWCSCKKRSSVIKDSLGDTMRDTCVKNSLSVLQMNGIL